MLSKRRDSTMPECKEIKLIICKYIKVGFAMTFKDSIFYLCV